MNVGIQDGLIDPIHEERMGQAVWLFMWCIRCETPQNGFVLGGMPLTYEEIAKRSKFKPRKVRLWLSRLRSYGYVEVEYLNYKMMKIIVNKSKKWHGKQSKLDFGNGSKATDTHRQKSVNRGTSTLTQKCQSNVRKSVNRAPEKWQSKQSSSFRKIESSPIPSLTLLETLAIPVSTWLDFKKMREGIHRPVLAGAEDLIARELLQLQAEGSPPIEVIEQAILTASFMLYPIRNGNRNGKQIESIDERRSREAKQNIVAVLGNGVRPLAGAHVGPLPAIAVGDQHRHVSGTLVGFEHGGARRGVSARNSDFAIYANGCNDPECSPRTQGSRSYTVDVDPLRGSSGDGTRIHGGRSESERRIPETVGHNFQGKKDSG